MGDEAVLSTYFLIDVFIFSAPTPLLREGGPEDDMTVGFGVATDADCLVRRCDRLVRRCDRLVRR